MGGRVVGVDAGVRYTMWYIHKGGQPPIGSGWIGQGAKGGNSGLSNRCGLGAQARSRLQELQLGTEPWPPQ